MIGFFFRSATVAPQWRKSAKTVFLHRGATVALRKKNPIINIPYGETFLLKTFFFSVHKKNSLFSAEGRLKIGYAT